MVHVENWVAGLDFASAKRGLERANTDSDGAYMGQNGAKKCLQNPCVPGRFRFCGQFDKNVQNKTEVERKIGKMPKKPEPGGGGLVKIMLSPA